MVPIQVKQAWANSTFFSIKEHRNRTQVGLKYQGYSLSRTQVGLRSQEQGTEPWYDSESRSKEQNPGRTQNPGTRNRTQV
jgi:hypothetical protein